MNRSVARAVRVACAAVVLVVILVALAARVAQAQDTPAGASELKESRFTVVAFPSEARLARSLLASAVARDTFPGLPRPRLAVRIMLAPDDARFRAWVGPEAPEWGAAIAFPSAARVSHSPAST